MIWKVLAIGAEVIRSIAFGFIVGFGVALLNNPDFFTEVSLRKWLGWAMIAIVLCIRTPRRSAWGGAERAA